MSKMQHPLPKYIFVLRIAVTAGLLAAGIIFGTLSFFTLSSYEYEAAVSRFDNLVDYAFDAIEHDLSEKESTVLAAARNMAYSKPNITEWPNVLVPGFYDIGYALRDSSSLGSIFFVPIVPPEKLASFEKFMFSYFLTEPRIGPMGGHTSLGKLGVFSLGEKNKPYRDDTGIVYKYASPNAMLTPIAQYIFSSHVTPRHLLFNMHCTSDFGFAIDAIVECSKHNNYTSAATACANITAFVLRPIGATGDGVKQIQSAILQPIYHEQNTSVLLGFMGGGFDWAYLFAPLFRTSPPGIDIIVENANVTLTYYADGSDVVYKKGFGDFHNRGFDSLRRSMKAFANEDGTENYSTYTITMYPTDQFVGYYTTNIPVYAAIASSILLGLCAATFFLYDYYMRKATAANEAVLETKRRFVRFISHEIRTPLNAVHLGLEALTTELRRMIDDPVGSHSSSAMHNALRSWLELSVEMMANSESAVDVLNDLLNYDKIEMGTLYLEFASVSIFDVVQSCVLASLNQVKQKHIDLKLENGVANEGNSNVDVDIEQQDFSQYIVIGDSARLAQVMRNLISNALKFTPENGRIIIEVRKMEQGIPILNIKVPSESVHLLEQPRAGSIRISVTDSGVGLTAEQLAQICSEGVQFNANELQAGKGSGLGLYITKGIVEQHGGTLTVSSDGLDHGTSFIIELPLFHQNPQELPSIHKNSTFESLESQTHASSPNQTPDRADGQALTEVRASLAAGAASLAASDEHDVRPAGEVMMANSASSPDVPLATAADSLATPQKALVPVCGSAPEKPKRILVVDDVGSNRKMLMRILTSKGYVCEQAENGQQAIDVYRASLASGLFFDAITMDFEMPVMNGPTATGHLRAMGCTVPIFGVTGNLLVDDIKYFKAQGANEVLGKPVSIVKFQELMRTFDAHGALESSAETLNLVGFSESV